MFCLHMCEILVFLMHEGGGPLENCGTFLLLLLLLFFFSLKLWLTKHHISYKCVDQFLLKFLTFLWLQNGILYIGLGKNMGLNPKPKKNAALDTYPSP